MIQKARIGISGVGVFIDAPVLLSDIAGHKILDIHHQMPSLAHLLVLGAVKNVELCRFGKSFFNERMFHEVLNQFDIRNGILRIETTDFQFLYNFLCHISGDLVTAGSRGFQRFSRGDGDPFRLELDDSAVAFLHFPDLGCNIHFPHFLP